MPEQVNSVAAPTVVEVAARATVSGPILPAGTATQVLEHNGTAWVAGRKITISKNAPGGSAADGDLWIRVP